MSHVVSLLLGILIVAVGADASAAASMYRWRDAAGGWHFSNRSGVAPHEAAEVELQPLSVLTVPSTSVPAIAVPKEEILARREAPCAGGGDPDLLAAAVESHLAVRRHGDLTLLVAGAPLTHSRDAVVTVKAADVAAESTAAMDQGAIAYPAGTACPSRPPLSRYAVASSRRGGARGPCDDFQRAFAEVGVAVSRDQGVARSFRAIAEHFVNVAAVGHGAGEGAARVDIAPWIVDAHVAQTRELGAQAAEFVDDLSVALEEIDGAARARGCW